MLATLIALREALVTATQVMSAQPSQRTSEVMPAAPAVVMSSTREPESR